MTGLWASIGVTCSYSNRPFSYTPAATGPYDDILYKLYTKMQLKRVYFSIQNYDYGLKNLVESGKRSERDEGGEGRTDDQYSPYTFYC